MVTHEIGHLLGIDNSEIPEAVMYAHVSPGRTRRALHSDDIAAMHTCYVPLATESMWFHIVR